MKKLLLMLVVFVYGFTQVQAQTKPVFNAEAAKKEIAAANLAFETAISKMDSIGISNLYATDAKWMNPNAPSVEGRGAIVGSVGNIIFNFGKFSFISIEKFN